MKMNDTGNQREEYLKRIILDCRKLLCDYYTSGIISPAKVGMSNAQTRCDKIEKDLKKIVEYGSNEMPACGNCCDLRAAVHRLVRWCLL